MSKTKPASELATGDTILAYGSGAECGFAGKTIDCVVLPDEGDKCGTTVVETTDGDRIRFALSQTFLIDDGGDF